jgi:CheY-like chemotaxis protein
MANTEETKTILLIDQNDEDVDLFQRAADRSCEARVRRVRSGQEALDVLASDEPLPQLIIVELDLPSSDAFALLRFVNSSPKLKAIPVIVLTGIHSEEHIDAARQMGAESVFLKPADLEEMEKLVYALCEVYIHYALPPVPPEREMAHAE